MKLMNESFKKSEGSELTKEQLRNFLSHYPTEAGHPRLERMTEYARKLGEPISEAVNAQVQARYDGWYVNLPDGKTERVATFQQNPHDDPPRNVYIVYNTNGTVSVARYAPGIEFKMQRVDK